MHHQLSDGPEQVAILGNSYKTQREQMDGYEDYVWRPDLTPWRCIDHLSASCSTA